MVENRDSSNQAERLQNNRIAVVTTTFYKEWSTAQSGNSINADQLRGGLAIEMLRSANGRGYQIVVVDGGSSEEFRSSLENLGITVMDQQEKGMSASRRQTFKEAARLPGVDVVCWTEPEKLSMIEHLQEAVKPIFEGKADIVVPARTAQSFQTYPDQQTANEQKLNHLFGKVLRLSGLQSNDSSDLDVSFGPRIFRNDPTILALFTRQYKLKENSPLVKIVKPDNYSNATFFPIMLALEKKLRVTSVPISYVHPKAQTEFETGNQEFMKKRIMQRNDIVRGAIQLARHLINNPQKPSELLV